MSSVDQVSTGLDVRVIADSIVVLPTSARENGCYDVDEPRAIRSRAKVSARSCGKAVRHKARKVILDPIAWRSLFSHQPRICPQQPNRICLFILDHKRRNISLNCLTYTILGSLARAKRPMQCDAETRTWLDQLSIPGANRWGPSLSRVCHPSFNAALLVVLVDSMASSMITADSKRVVRLT